MTLGSSSAGWLRTPAQQFLQEPPKLPLSGMFSIVRIGAEIRVAVCGFQGSVDLPGLGNDGANGIGEALVQIEAIDARLCGTGRIDLIASCLDA